MFLKNASIIFFFNYIDLLGEVKTCNRNYLRASDNNCIGLQSLKTYFDLTRKNAADVFLWCNSEIEANTVSKKSLNKEMSSKNRKWVQLLTVYCE